MVGYIHAHLRQRLREQNMSVGIKLIKLTELSDTLN